jgi:hypothetical protein
MESRKQGRHLGIRTGVSAARLSHKETGCHLGNQARVWKHGWAANLASGFYATKQLHLQGGWSLGGHANV